MRVIYVRRLYAMGDMHDSQPCAPTACACIYVRSRLICDLKTCDTLVGHGIMTLTWWKLCLVID